MIGGSVNALVHWWFDVDPYLAVLIKLTAFLGVAWIGYWQILNVNPRWHVLLWRTTAMGLCLTALLHVITPAVTISAAPTLTGQDMPITPKSPGMHETVVVDPDLPPINQQIISQPLAQTDVIAASPLSVREMLIGIWLTGFVFCVVRMVSGSWYVHRLITDSTDVSASVAERFQQVRAVLVKDQQVLIRVSSRITTPILCGIRRPIVLIPRSLADESRYEHLACVFAHELAHVKSKDLKWNAVLLTLSSVLWFHPLVWFIRSVHASSCEAVSDRIAASYIGNVSDYVRSLAQVALDAVLGPPSLGLSMARSTGVAKRVESLRRNSFPRALSVNRALCAIACCLMLAALIGGTNIAPADDPTTKVEKDAAGTTTDNSPAEQALKNALKYLAKAQKENGSFGDEKTLQYSPATTGLAGMAMLASGSKPGKGPYGAELQRSVDFVVNCVQEDGAISVNSSNMLYVHAYALRFLAEVEATSPSPRTKAAMTKAAKLLVDCQNSLGGWRYSVGAKDADSSVTSCVLIALATSRKAGATVPQETFDRAIAYLKGCQNDDGGFSYVSGLPQSATPRTAAVVSSLVLSGIEDDQVKAAFKYLNDDQNSSGDSGHFYFYKHYHLSTAMGYANAKQFNAWHTATSHQLVKTQSADGSWKQKGFGAEYATAQACLALLADYKRR